MRIPTRFKLLGQTITVVHDKELEHRDNDTGQAVYRRNQIRLQPATEGVPLCQTHVESVFCHELTHFIFHYAAYQYSSDKPLTKQEGLVEMCGSLLHQALSTMEYE